MRHSSSDQPSEAWSARLRPANAQTIRGWAYGQIATDELFDCDEGGLHPAGLFSQRIFGPIRDGRCGCDKFEGEDHTSVVCDRCGVQVGARAMRNNRFGLIELAAPVVHPWFYGTADSPLEILLDLPHWRLRDILSHRAYVDINNTSRLGFYRFVHRYTPDKSADLVTGDRAVRDMLARLSLPELAANVSGQLAEGNTRPGQTLRDALHRLRLIESLLDAHVNPEDFVLHAIPVIPAGLRWFRMSRRGEVQVDWITHCYQHIVRINRRLEDRNRDALLELGAIELDTQPTRELQLQLRGEVRQLFAWLLGYGSPAADLPVPYGEFVLPIRRPWRGLPTHGVPPATVVPDPSIGLAECRIPYAVAREVWKPRIISQISSQGRGPETARRYFKEGHWLAERILEVMYEKRTTLVSLPAAGGRQMRVMALKSRRTNSPALHVHPLLAQWVKAPVFGEQALPWHAQDFESGLEAKPLVGSPLVLRDGATGRAAVGLTGAALLGCFLATWEPDGQPMCRDSLNRRIPPQGERLRYCASADEVRMAIEQGACRLDSPVLFPIPFQKKIVISAPDRYVDRRGLTGYFTTAGRVLLNDLLPDELPFIDAPVGGDVTRYLVEQTMELIEPSSVLPLVERLARFGFDVVTRRGYTLAASDFRPPQAKPTLLEAAWRNVAKAHKHYHRGLTSVTERYNQVWDHWRHVQEQLGVEVMHTLFDASPQPHPLRALVHSGAGINLRELRKLTGMVGPVPVRATLRSETPVINSLAEGLTSHEYFRHARYERSLAVSHTLRQQQARRLLYRLANVAENVVVTIDDCGSQDGVAKHAPRIDDRPHRNLEKLITGRVSLDTFVDPHTDETIVRAGDLITRSAVRRLESMNIDQVRVRSPIFCLAREGVCRKCYGSDLRTEELVEPDTAIGTLAALTIGGELGRLEYFTYYGLSARRDPYPEGKIYAAHAGKVSLKNLDLAINRAGERIVVSSSGEIELLDDWERVVEQHVVPHGAVLPVAAGSCVQRGDLLAEWNVHFQPILAKAPGRVRFEDLVPKRSIESEPSASGKLCWKVLSWPRGRYPRIRVTDIAKETVDTCYLPRGAQLDVVDGQQVEMGELLARAPTVSASAYESIEGGLARLSDLFHLRPPESTAVLAEADGIVEQTTMVEPGICNVLVHLVDHRGELCGDSIVQRVDMQRYTRLLVRNKQRVKAGEPLTSGDPDPHEVLRILGPETAARRLLDEMQMCFLLQGESIEIDDRHFEVILAQMLRYVEVESPGDSQFSAGEVVERSRLFALNRKMHDFLVVVDRGDSLLEREKIASLKLFEKMVARAEKRGDDPPQGRLPWPAGWRALLLGIDQAARRSSSFLTAAGYGTTQRALVEAAVANRSFGLETVKDRVLLGRKLQKTDRK